MHQVRSRTPQKTAQAMSGFEWDGQATLAAKHLKAGVAKWSVEGTRTAKAVNARLEAIARQCRGEQGRLPATAVVVEIGDDKKDRAHESVQAPRSSTSVKRQYADVRQVAVFIIVVEPVTNDEFIRDREATEIGFEVHFLGALFAQ